MSAQIKPQLLHSLVLEPMEMGDLTQVLRIEEAAYSHPWTYGNFVDSLNAGYTLNCAWRELDGVVRRRELVGYSVCMPVVDELHLLNLTVAPAHWRQGLGHWLLSEVHTQAQRSAAVALWLEVRPSNVAALILYQHYGFKLMGTRRDYYPAVDGKREDALVLKLALNNVGVAT